MGGFDHYHSEPGFCFFLPNEMREKLFMALTKDLKALLAPKQSDFVCVCRGGGGGRKK